jgi:hypothetical protein
VSAPADPVLKEWEGSLGAVIRWRNNSRQVLHTQVPQHKEFSMSKPKMVDSRERHDVVRVVLCNTLEAPFPEWKRIIFVTINGDVLLAAD